MIDATIITYVGDRQQESVIHNVLYTFPGVGAGVTSSELVAIEIPALDTDVGGREYSGNADIIELLTVAVASLSTDLDMKVLNKGDMTAVDTINEIISYIEIDKLYVDSEFDEYIIRNRDDIKDSLLYVWLNNDDGSNATGTVTMELSYRTAQYKT